MEIQNYYKTCTATNRGKHHWLTRSVDGELIKKIIGDIKLDSRGYVAEHVIGGAAAIDHVADGAIDGGTIAPHAVAAIGNVATIALAFV